MTKFVYFVAALGKVKIGCSNDVERRLRTIGEWVPVPLDVLAVIPGSISLEQALHEKFADEWSHGEWFHATPRLLAFASALARGEPVNIDSEQVERIATRRRAMIADKKRLSRKMGLLPASIADELGNVPKGVAIPDDLRERAFAAIASKPLPTTGRAA